MAQDAEVKFWWIPELVEHLLTFMDPASILNLAHSHSRVEQVLQSASVWTGLIKRVCPYDREEQDFPPTNLIIQRKCEQVRALLGLLHLLQNSENQQLELLELIQLRFSIQDDLGRSQFVSLCDPMIVIGPSYHVSPLGFLLLEEVEGSRRLEDDFVTVIWVDKLEEPLISALSSRVDCQGEQVDILRIETLSCNNNMDAEAFSTLVENSWQIRMSALEVGDDVGEKGWRELATSIESLEGKHWLNAAIGFNVSASRKSMVKGRREDLQTIWEFSTDETTDVAADGTFWSVRFEKGGEEWTYHDWERLEEIMGMTEEEWFEEME